MNSSSFTTKILVEQSPSESFNAINNVRGWWSEEIVGSTNHPNAEFQYSYGQVHICRIKIIDFIPEKKIVWYVMDNYFKFTKNKNEWNDTLVSFEISKRKNKTQICFTHFGLVPELECYGVCIDAWSIYINNSLKDLITKGKGQPNLSESRIKARTMMRKL